MKPTVMVLSAVTTKNASCSACGREIKTGTGNGVRVFLPTDGAVSLHLHCAQELVVAVLKMIVKAEGQP